MSAVPGQSPLAHRGLRPPHELAARRPHGDRTRYVCGCRCDLCREANVLYEAARKQARARGDWNGLVRAEPARQHLLALQRMGLGRRTVSDVTNVAQTVLQEIIAGTRPRIRARTERRILSVTDAARADASLVPAKRVWQLIRELYAQGFTEADVAGHLGYARPYLQIGKRQVFAITQLQIERLHARLNGTLRPAKQTRAWWTELLQEGFDINMLMARLDLDDAALITALTGRPHHVTAAFEQSVERLYRRLMS